MIERRSQPNARTPTIGIELAAMTGTTVGNRWAWAKVAMRKSVAAQRGYPGSLSILNFASGAPPRPCGAEHSAGGAPANDRVARTGALQVRDGVLRRGLALAAPAALEDLAREVAAAETEGERQRQDEAAEEHTEGDQHHVAPDADLDQRGGDSEEEHDPAGGAGQEPRLDDAGIDRGDQHRLPEEVRGEPADDQDQQGGQEARQEAQEHAGRAGRAR